MSDPGSTTVKSSSQSFSIKRKALPPLVTKASSHNVLEKSTSLTIKSRQGLEGGESGTTRGDMPNHERHRSTSCQQKNQPEDLALDEVKDLSPGPDGSLTQKLINTAASPSADRSHTSILASTDDKESWLSILAKEFTAIQIGEGVGSVKLNEFENRINQRSMHNATDSNSSRDDFIIVEYENETGLFIGVPQDLLQDHSKVPTAATRKLIEPRAAPLETISYAKAIQNFHGTGAPGELKFLKDATIEVLGPANQEWDPARKDWWKGKIGNRIGVFPMSHVEPTASPMQAQSQNPVTRVRALYDFVPAEDAELAFTRGDVLLITDAMQGFWWMAATESRTGMIPINYVEVLPIPTAVELFLGRVTHVRSLLNFTPTERGQLAFKTGDLIRLLSTRFDGWWLGELRGKEGIFPLSHVEIVPNDRTPASQYLADKITGSTAFVKPLRPGHGQGNDTDSNKAMLRGRMPERTARLSATPTEAEGENSISDTSVDVKTQVHGSGNHKIKLRRLTEQEATAKIAEQPNRRGSLSLLSDVHTSISSLKKRRATEDLSGYSPLQGAQPAIAKTKLKVDIYGARLKIAAKGKPEDNFLSCQVLLDGIVVYRTKGVTSPTCDPLWNESFSVTLNLNFIRNTKLTCLLICDCFRQDSLGEKLGEATLDFGSINTYDPVDVTTPLKHTSGNRILEGGNIRVTMRFIEPSQHANKADTPREYLPFNPVNIPDISSEPSDRVEYSGDGSTPGSSRLATPKGLINNGISEGHYQSYRPARKEVSPVRINKPSGNAFAGRKCAICEERLENMLPSGRKLRLSCRHASHEACLEEYAKEFNCQACPACNVSHSLEAAKSPSSQHPTSPGGNKPYTKTAADATPRSRNFELLGSSERP